MKYSIRFTKRSEKHDDGTCTIRMRVSWNRNRYDMVLPQRVPEKYWDAKKECCKSSWSESHKYNRFMKLMVEKVDTYFMECDTRSYCPTQAEIKGLFVASDYSDDKSIEKLVEQFIENGTRTRNWSSSTIRNFRMMLFYLMEFDPQMNAASLTKEKILQFVEFYTTKHNMKSSSAKKVYDNFKWFLKWCVDNDLGVPRNSLGLRPRFNYVENEPLYLTMDELNALANVKPETEAQEQVRDIFVFCCYSGLRYSDVYKLKKTDIYNDKINFVTTKTKDSLSVDLNKHSRELLDKYKDNPSDLAFPVRQLCTHGKILKKLAQKANLNAMVTRTYYVGSVRHETTEPKYKLISSHWARRTFVTIALTLGIPAEVVMKWTGHKDFDNMKPYIAIVDKLKKENMQKFDTI